MAAAGMSISTTTFISLAKLQKKKRSQRTHHCDYQLFRHHHCALCSNSPYWLVRVMTSHMYMVSKEWVVSWQKLGQNLEVATLDSRGFLQRQKRIIIYYVKKFIKESQKWEQTLVFLLSLRQNVNKWSIHWIYWNQIHKTK